MSSLLLTFPILSNPTLIPTAFSQEGPGSAAAVTITPEQPMKAIWNHSTQMQLMLCQEGQFHGQMSILQNIR